MIHYSYFLYSSVPQVEGATQEGAISVWIVWIASLLLKMESVHAMLSNCIIMHVYNHIG